MSCGTMADIEALRPVAQRMTEAIFASPTLGVKYADVRAIWYN